MSRHSRDSVDTGMSIARAFSPHTALFAFTRIYTYRSHKWLGTRFAAAVLEMRLWERRYNDDSCISNLVAIANRSTAAAGPTWRTRFRRRLRWRVPEAYFGFAVAVTETFDGFAACWRASTRVSAVTNLHIALT